MSSSSRSERPLSGLFKHSAIYSAAPVLRQVISVGMHRLYTGWMGTAAMGVKELVDLFAIGLQQILGQNVLGSMVRFYFDHEDEKDRAKVVTSTTLTITVVAWLVCGVALAFSAELRPLVLGEGERVPGPELTNILKLVLLLVPFQLSTIAGFYYLQILKRSTLFTTIQTAKLLVEVGLNFWLIGARGLGVRGFLMSMLAGEMLTSLALTGWMLVTLRPKFDWRVLKPILVYAAPLIPVGFCQLALHQIDRRLLKYYGGTEEAGQIMTGIYGHGYKISYLVTAMLLGPFIQIFHPWIFEVRDAGQRGRMLARACSYAVLGVGGASLGVILFGRQAAILLADPENAREMFDAYQVIPWIAAGYVLWALYHVSQMPLFIAKRTGRLFGINLAAVVLNVGLNMILIPRYGITGAAITTFVTFAVLAVMGMVAGRSEVHTPFELGRIGGVLLAVLLGGALALWIDHLEATDEIGVVAALATKAAGCSALLLALWYGVLRRNERTDLIAWYRARRGR